MRTTITLDKDVAIALDRLRHSRNESVEEIANEVLREGLQSLEATRAKPESVRTRSVDLGRCLVDNVDDVARVLAIDESESFR